MPTFSSSLTECWVGLGLQLAGGRDVGHQRQVHEHRVVGPKLVAELADGFEEGQGFDVADGAADFHQHEVEVGGFAQDGFLDRVGDVGDDLDGGAEVVAATLLGDHVLVDAPGGGVVELGRVDAGEAFVVAEVEVCLGAVIGDEDLPVLVRAHGAGVDVEVGVELAQLDLEAAGLQQGAERGGCNSFAQG